MTLFLLSGAERRHPGVEAWFADANDELRRLARTWFERIRASGPDVRELLHDGFPTACVESAAFAYVSAHKAHANLGFHYGCGLPDPARLLEGSGKRMRHAKLRWGEPINEAALNALIVSAYRDIRLRLSREE